MNKFDVIVIGGGPAGLGAAVEAARLGARTLLLDENSRPGGQLFKQIHKFFGSKEHYAGTRGFDIGENLLKEAASLNVVLKLDTRVWGVFPGGIVTAYCGEKGLKFEGKTIILATGASENVLSFPGSTLPGVITAGAAQTMVNLHRVLPGKKFVVVGSGNVGLIVSYQLKQAGAEVLAIVEALPQISGYAVHAAKVKRAGVRILLSHTVKEAIGEKILEQVILCKLDSNMKPIAGTEFTLDADTLCLAVGLNPRVELAALCGCHLIYSPVLGGMMPWHDENMCTSQSRILVAGDLAGVEEASTALDEGRLAGLSAVQKLGLRNFKEVDDEMQKIKDRLTKLRQGPFGEKRQLAKQGIISMKIPKESCL
ncbi:MAG TPA: FAD-dependent oxidoreductase [Clostridia bacterium]|jgi:thioredoxin reductase|nr:FAD-dependent oxidoreductase [Clostridia bacterium]